MKVVESTACGASVAIGETVVAVVIAAAVSSLDPAAIPAGDTYDDTVAAIREAAPEADAELCHELTESYKEAYRAAREALKNAGFGSPLPAAFNGQSYETSVPSFFLFVGLDVIIVARLFLNRESRIYPLQSFNLPV